MNTPANVRFYTPEELCERWSVHLNTVYREIGRKRLAAVKIGHQLRIRDTAVRQYEQERER